MSRYRYKKPNRDVRELKTRTCINKLSRKCLGTFKSEWPGDRTCCNCREIIRDMPSVGGPVSLNTRG